MSATTVTHIKYGNEKSKIVDLAPYLWANLILTTTKKNLSPAQVGNPKNPTAHASHLSPTTCSLQKHFPDSTSHLSSSDPSVLHPQA